MKMNICNGKNSKLYLLGTAILIILTVGIFILLPRNSKNSETVKIYYQSKDESIEFTKTAVFRKKDAEEIKQFLNGLKFDQIADEALYDINMPAYQIEGEQHNSSYLDFNYNIYVRKDYYIVFDTFKGKYAFADQKNYDSMKSFLSIENLNEFQSDDYFY
jgi:hypothetical protein